MTTMGLSMSVCSKVQVKQPRVNNFQCVLNMKPFFRRKDKVVFVVGPTGTGKSKLAIELATHFPAEVVNCDKMQVYKGLDIVTNKVTVEECRGVPHHMIGVADPTFNFTSHDFCHHTWDVLDSILARDRVPIIAGGSNSYIESMIRNDSQFQLRYECCFLCVDVSLPVLYSFLINRVDRMIEGGMIDEVRDIFDPKNVDYSQGIRRAIGVQELDRYLRSELGINVDYKTRSKLLDSAIAKIKQNNCKLASRQLQNIHRLQSRWIWNMHRIDATEVFLRSGKDEAEKAWETLVTEPGTAIVDRFLNDAVPTIVPITAVPIAIPAMAAGVRGNGRNPKGITKNLEWN